MGGVGNPTRGLRIPTLFPTYTPTWHSGAEAECSLNKHSARLLKPSQTGCFVTSGCCIPAPVLSVSHCSTIYFGKCRTPSGYTGGAYLSIKYQPTLSRVVRPLPPLHHCHLQPATARQRKTSAMIGSRRYLDQSIRLASCSSLFGKIIGRQHRSRKGRPAKSILNYC